MDMSRIRVNQLQMALVWLLLSRGEVKRAKQKGGVFADLKVYMT